MREHTPLVHRHGVVTHRAQVDHDAVARPDARSARAGWLATQRAGTWNVSNISCTIFSRLSFG